MNYNEMNKLNIEIKTIEQKKIELKKELKNEIITQYAEDIVKQTIDLKECKELLKELIQEIKYVENK
ncbi:hypothetical protein [uncultured Clostridium sp.]|uniref:hypothetical protein n=1 Tax=uncultured Clostridium sp. TaxID=59620 RepID=UPI003216E7A1